MTWPLRHILGGNSFDAARGVCIDHAGNIIVVGGTSSTDFPTTEGAYCRHLTPAGPDVGRLGATDVFVAKFTPEGKLLWSTYLGGPNYDRAYSVDVDSHNRIFVSGRAGPGFPTTKGAFQPGYVDTFPKEGDVTKAEYGRQNGIRRLLRFGRPAGLVELCPFDPALPGHCGR